MWILVGAVGLVLLGRLRQRRAPAAGPRHRPAGARWRCAPPSAPAPDAWCGSSSPSSLLLAGAGGTGRSAGRRGRHPRHPCARSRQRAADRRDRPRRRRAGLHGVLSIASGLLFGLAPAWRLVAPGSDARSERRRAAGPAGPARCGGAGTACGGCSSRARSRWPWCCSSARRWWSAASPASPPCRPDSIRPACSPSS